MIDVPAAVLPGRRARTDSTVRTGALVALWLSLLLVTYWWVAGGGVQELGGWATGLTSVGRLTGLLAAVLLLAQVVLMARVPVLEAAFGQDRLAQLHRLTGFTSFNLMIAHLVTITWGYAAGELTKTPATLWDLTVDYPGMLLAVGGTAFLCLSVLTSIKAARRRMRYESWHLLHLYAYLGVGLALPHQLWTGQEFLSSTGRTVFWWTAWSVAAATILVYRIGVPVARNVRHRLRVTNVVREADGVVSVYVGGRHLDRLRTEAGQFFSWRFLGRPGWTRANPYSLSAAPDGRSLRITVQEAGDGSAALSAVRPGARVLVEGPFGRLSDRARTGRKIALIGAGVGITPLRALAEGLDYAPGDAVLVQRFTDQQLFRNELQTLHHQRGLSLLTLPGHRRSSGSWLGAGPGELDDLQALRYWIPDIAERDVYLCGPDAWTQLVQCTLTAAGLPAERLHLETFKW
ncbi:ferredoxin reductase family protein [Kribbella pratensis]|uniref:Ferric reductase n=1 Tax=Kribbella pratensis TaxID=2512112 RepID=A0A4R8CN82_9ACTN|nr:ferredoxin reductase family protein [Kribbella pratensis]TDW77556.1 putative ferric reductase [Kribbella pratensis]